MILDLKRVETVTLLK